MAGKSYEISAGKRSRAAGVVAVIAAVSPLTLGTLRLMNVSPLIALLVGFSILGLFAGSGAGGAGAVGLGGGGEEGRGGVWAVVCVMVGGWALGGRSEWCGGAVWWVWAGVGVG